MVILRTYAKNVFMSFGRKNSGWMDMWGLNLQRPDRLRSGKVGILHKTEGFRDRRGR